MKVYNDGTDLEWMLYEEELIKYDSEHEGYINFNKQLKWAGLGRYTFNDWTWGLFEGLIYNLKDELNWGHQITNDLWSTNRELAEDRVVNVEFLLNKIEWILKTALELKKGLGRDYNFNYDQYDWTIGQESFDYDRFWEEEEYRI